MSGISNDLSAISGSSATPSQRVDEALVGDGLTRSPSMRRLRNRGDATLLDLSTAASSSSSIGSELNEGVPADVVAAGALVDALSSQISGSGSEASSAYSLLSAVATLKLTQD